MTAHGKERWNRYGDVIAYCNHMHNHRKDCIAGATVIINCSPTYENPDPFAGSNVTGETAERLGRKWIGVEINEEYVRGSALRFEKPLRVEKPVSRRQNGHDAYTDAGYPLSPPFAQ